MYTSKEEATEAQRRIRQRETLFKRKVEKNRREEREYFELIERMKAEHDRRKAESK